MCFPGTKYEIYHEHVAYLHSILWCHARLFDQNTLQVVCCNWFLSRISDFSSYVFRRRCRSFTSRKLYVSRKTFFGFLQLSDRAYVSRARCIGLFPLLVILVPHDSNVAVYEQVCWLAPDVFLDISPRERSAREPRSFAASLRAGSPLSHTRERR